MFKLLVLVFAAMLAVAFAAPEPQYVAGVPVAYSGYGGYAGYAGYPHGAAVVRTAGVVSPLAYSAYGAYPYNTYVG